MTPIFVDHQHEDEDEHIIMDKQPSLHVEVTYGHLVDVLVGRYWVITHYRLF
jgi:hypothetical protein